MPAVGVDSVCLSLYEVTFDNTFSSVGSMTRSVTRLSAQNDLLVSPNTCLHSSFHALGLLDILLTFSSTAGETRAQQITDGEKTPQIRPACLPSESLLIDFIAASGLKRI